MNGSTATANLWKQKTLFSWVSYGVLTDERNSYVLLQRTTEIQLRRNGYVMLETTHEPNFTSKALGKLTSPRVDHSTTWLTITWVCRRIVLIPWGFEVDAISLKKKVKWKPVTSWPCNTLTVFLNDLLVCSCVMYNKTNENGIFNFYAPPCAINCLFCILLPQFRFSINITLRNQWCHKLTNKAESTTTWPPAENTFY